MSLAREQLLDLLPCFVCGDLPPDLIASIDAAVQDDPDLAQRVQALHNSREQCLELLGSAPASFDFEVPIHAATPHAPSTPAAPAVATEPTTGPATMGLVLGIAAAAALLVAVGSASTRPPAGQVVGAMHAAVSSQDAALVTADSPRELAAALRDRGVSPQLAMAPDLSAMGFQMVGASILGPDEAGGAPGVAVVYERDGERFVCQIQLARPTYGAPDATDLANGTVLRAYRTDQGAIVSWFGGGRWCVFGGPSEPIAMLELVKARMTRG